MKYQSPLLLDIFEYCCDSTFFHLLNTVDGQWRSLHWTLCPKGYQEGKVSPSDCNLAFTVVHLYGIFVFTFFIVSEVKNVFFSRLKRTLTIA